MSTLTITIELGPLVEDGYHAYQLIAQSNIPHNRGEDAEGDFLVRGEHVGTWSIGEDIDESVRYTVGDKVTWRMSRSALYPGDGVEYPGTVIEVMPADDEHPHGGEYRVELNGDNVLAWWEELETR
jgi:hypothetical protein